MTEFSQTFSMFPQNRYEEEIFNLKKQLRNQESEWKKNKAVLEQRIEILELQNRELKEREEGLKKMNNSIFSALKDLDKENDPTYGKLVKEHENSKLEIAKEFSEYKIRNQEIIRNLEKENRELKDKVSDIDIKYNQTAIYYEKNDAALHQKLQSLEEEKKNSSVMLRFYEDERRSFKEKEQTQHELQAKVAELRHVIDKQTNDHRREIDKIHYEYTETIQNLKSYNDKERHSFESQVHKLLDTKKLDETLFDDLKRNYEGQVSLLRKERDNVLKKNEGLENQIVQLTESVKALETRVSDQKTEHAQENKELKKLKLKIVDMEYVIIGRILN